MFAAPFPLTRPLWILNAAGSCFLDPSGAQGRESGGPQVLLVPPTLHQGTRVPWRRRGDGPCAGPSSNPVQAGAAKPGREQFATQLGIPAALSRQGVFGVGLAMLQIQVGMAGGLISLTRSPWPGCQPGLLTELAAVLPSWTPHQGMLAIAALLMPFLLASTWSLHIWKRQVPPCWLHLGNPAATAITKCQLIS